MPHRRYLDQPHHSAGAVDQQLARFVAWIAPRGPLDFAVKWLILVSSVKYLDLVTELLIDGFLDPDFFEDTLMLVIIAAPFVTAFLVTMRHQARLQERLIQYSFRDQLTGLRNRRAFWVEADALLGACAPYTILLIDLDHFKSVNDRFGHAVGDQCLKAFGAHLTGIAGPQDLVARFGGEEFIVLVSGDVEGAPETRINEILRGTVYDSPEGPQHISASVGAARICGKHMLDAGINRADAALYRSKDSGRARITWDCSGPDATVPVVPREAARSRLRRPSAA